MSFVAVAIGGSALVGAGVGLYSANKAANTQANAANNSLDFQKQVYSDSQPRFATANTAFNNAQATANNSLSPWINTGQGANYTLAQLTGSGNNNGGGSGNNTPDYSSFFNSPDYNFAQQQGQRGVINAANAQGVGLSGGTLKDLATFNNGLASQQYGNYFNRLMGLSQLGQNSASALTTASSNIAGGIGNLATGQANSNNAASSSIGNTIQGVGQAQASGIVGGANAVTGGINSGVSNSLLASYLGKSPSAYSSGNVTGNSNATGAGTDAQYNSWGLQNGLTSADL